MLIRSREHALLWLPGAADCPSALVMELLLFREESVLPVSSHFPWPCLLLGYCLSRGFDLVMSGSSCKMNSVRHLSCFSGCSTGAVEQQWCVCAPRLGMGMGWFLTRGTGRVSGPAAPESAPAQAQDTFPCAGPGTE